MSALIQSAINVSEGRRPAVIDAIVLAAQEAPGVILADLSADEDHNRMVLSLLGGPSSIRSAAVAVARAAVERIDLRLHHGAHPRLGVVDVIPLTPLRDISLAECAELAREIGAEIARELRIPVYFYEASALPGRHSALPQIRAGGFEGLFGAPLAGDRAPDAGPSHPHPTAGATVVGARGPLVAYNVDLNSTDVTIARRIAGSIRRERASRAELAGVRALGLWLPQRGRAQVSMNVTRPADTPLAGIFDFVRAAAEREGVTVWGSEIIGLITRASLSGPPDRILWRGHRDTQLLETWLDAM